jgi:hypothetical protein
MDDSELYEDGPMYSFYYSAKQEQHARSVQRKRGDEIFDSFVLIDGKWRRYSEMIAQGSAKEPLTKGWDDLEYLGDAPDNHLCMNGFVDRPLQKKFGKHLTPEELESNS